MGHERMDTVCGCIPSRPRPVPHPQVTNLDLQVPLGYRLEGRLVAHPNVTLTQPERVALGNIYNA